MELDFAVVFSARQRFGDRDEDDFQKTEAPFVGPEKEYAFSCPDVDRAQQAILLFQCQGTNVQQSLEINGQQIFGGIPASVDFAPAGNLIFIVGQWSGNVMLIHPGVLHENNVLRIKSGKIRTTDNLDNFIIDNVVVGFKRRRSPGPVVHTDTATQGIA